MQRSTSALVLAAATLLAAACAAPASVPAPSSSAAAKPTPVATRPEPPTSARPSLIPSPLIESIDSSSIPSTAPGPLVLDPLPLDGPFAGPDTATVRIYLWLEGEPDATGLVPVLRELPRSEPIETSTVEALLAGPSPSERTGTPELSTQIPDQTRLLGLTMRDDVAIVDLSADFATAVDPVSALGRLGQVTYTLTAFPWIRSVEFTVEGRPLEAMAGGDVVLPGPLGRADPRDIGQNEPFLERILPVIFVDGPSWGETLWDGTIVQGTARLATKDVFWIALYDAAGGQLSQATGAEPCAGPCGGGFEATLNFRVDEPQWGTLRVAEYDASGTPLAPLRAYPVWLVPTVASGSDACGC